MPRFLTNNTGNRNEIIYYFEVIDIAKVKSYKIRKMSRNLRIIAIDGLSGSGKGTLARKTADHFGFDYLDTGKIYRAVAYDLFRHGHAADDQENALEFIRKFDFSLLDNPELKSEEMGARASLIAKDQKIRAELIATQRNFAHDAKIGAVLDGRDIATIICPDAPIKIFMIADAKIRANRRYLELQSLGKTVMEEQILQNIEDRDFQDQNRPIAPLVATKDSYIMDSSHQSIDKCLELAIRFIIKKQPSWERLITL